jgi:hypothetical protein
MNSETIIIGLLSVALFVVPIMYIQHKQKQKAGKALQEFLVMAGQLQVKPTQHELWNDRYAISLDEEQKKLFYLKKDDVKEQKHIVNLADTKRCAVVSVSRDVNGSKIIDQIGLSLTSRTGKDLYLGFYNKEESLNMSGELLIAQKWSGLINAAIAAVPAATKPPVATA